MDSFISIKNETWRRNIRAYIIDADQNFLLVKIPEHIGPEWEFVGGGIHQDESEEQALRREVFEEVGFAEFEIIAKQPELVLDRFDPHLVDKLKLSYIGLSIQEFLIQVPTIKAEAKPQTDEVSEYCWVNSKHILPLLTFGNQAKSFRRMAEFANIVT